MVCATKNPRRNVNTLFMFASTDLILSTFSVLFNFHTNSQAVELLVVEELLRAISSQVKQTLSFEQKKLSTNAPWHFEYVVDPMDPY